MSHIGIELRISLNGEPIMQANSDLMHFRAQLDAGREWSTILQTARSMLATADVDFIGLPPDSRLMIEMRAVDLPDEYPDE